MKLQIKNPHKVIAGVTLLVALLFLTAFIAKGKVAQAQNNSIAQTRAGSIYNDIRFLMMSDKVEALKKFITGWQEIQE